VVRYGGFIQSCHSAVGVMHADQEVPVAYRCAAGGVEHLDVAGTAMGVQPSEINQSWGPGWGVRLLDKLIAEHYEK